MTALKKIPFFLVLLSVFFCLHGAVENFGFVSFSEVFFVGISMLVVMALLFLISWFFTRKTLFASLITIFISVWYFFFGAIHDFIKGVSLVSFLKPYTIILPFLFAITLLWIIFLKKKPGNWQKLTLYLNILLLIYSLLDVVKLSTKAMQPSKTPMSVKFDYDKVTNKPNVYFLLFDGYPGQKTLSDSFNFNNNELNNFLVQHQFVQLPIQSNYDYTLYSMSSMFNLQYVNNTYKVNKETQIDGQMRQQEIKEGAIFNIFQKMGYTILNHSVFDIKELPGLSDENSFLLGHSILLTNKILINRIRKDLTFLFTDDQIKYVPFLKNQSVFIDRNNNLKAEKLVVSSAERKTNKPIFCYAHLLLPHAPYFFDSTGKNTDYKKMTDIDVVLNKQNFISYLKYTNSVAKNIITAIRQKDSTAVVIFLSDHGVRTFPRKPYMQPGNFDNVCYLYLPDNHYKATAPTFTNVNIFRYLFNVEFNQQMPLLKDTSFTYIP